MTLTNFPNGVSSFGVPVLSGPTVFGNVWFVNTVSGSDGNDGTSRSSAFLTMAAALARVGDNDVVFFQGKVREQLVAPLGVTGVKIIGAVGGNVRDDDGAKWYAPASPTAGKALIEIREQGWEFHNFLMTPDATGGACIKAHRNEDATYPDSSHFICNRMRFVGGGGTPIGIQDVGGNHHYSVLFCEFQSLTTAISCTSTSIAVPQRNTIMGCAFQSCTNDIVTSLSYSRILYNTFLTNDTVIINTVANSGQGGNNTVAFNTFPVAESGIAPTKFDGGTGDVWTSNSATDQVSFGDPA